MGDATGFPSMASWRSAGAASGAGTVSAKKIFIENLNDAREE